MKTNQITLLARLGGCTLALALFAAAAGNLGSTETSTAKGGAARLLSPTTPAVVPASAPGDAKAMACAKCQNTALTVTDRTARGANKPTVTVARHLCASCANELVTTGHGKAQATTSVHQCTSCGSANPSRCATAHSGHATTPGMEK